MSATMHRAAESERDQFEAHITAALDDWNWTDERVDDWWEDLCERKTRTLVVVESWFARKELDGVEVLFGDVAHETDDATLLQHASPWEQRHERQGHYVDHITEQWIPNSVIKYRVTVQPE